MDEYPHWQHQPELETSGETYNGGETSELERIVRGEGANLGPGADSDDSGDIKAVYNEEMDAYVE